MTFPTLYRCWNRVYVCFVSQSNVKTPKSILNMAKCTFVTQNSQNQKMEGRSNSDAETQTDAQESEEDKKKTFLVVGLGNCESRDSRHSIGMHILDRISSHFKLHWGKDDFRKSGGFVAEASLDSGVEVILLKPRVPMNINGTSVAKAVRSYKILPDNVYLIHDDLDKSIGTFQLKESGSAGGHNGIKSVIHSLRTDNIKRLRIGIDRPDSQDEVVDYVLDKFTYEQELALLPVIASSVAALFKHIGQQCEVNLDVQLSSDPQILQWKGLKVAKKSKHKKRWDSDPEADNFKSGSWGGGSGNRKNYVNSRMSKWEEEGDSDFPRQRRSSRSDDYDDFPRKNWNSRSDDYDDFPRKNWNSRSDDNDDFPRKNWNSRSDGYENSPRNKWNSRSDDNDDFPRKKWNSRSDDNDDFPRKKWNSRSDDNDDFPRKNWNSRSDDNEDFPRQKGHFRSNDFENFQGNKWNSRTDDYDDFPRKKRGSRTDDDFSDFPEFLRNTQNSRRDDTSEFGRKQRQNRNPQNKNSDITRTSTSDYIQESEDVFDDHSDDKDGDEQRLKKENVAPDWRELVEKRRS